MGPGGGFAPKDGQFSNISSDRYSLGETVNVKMIRDKITGNASASRQLTGTNGSIIPGTNKMFKLNWASGGGMVDRTRDAAGPEFSIFVGDLSPEVNDLLLMNTFQARYGSIKSAKVVTDPQTGMSRGYGFVRFGEELDQQRAMNEMNGQYCGSRPMRIASATPKNKIGGGGGMSVGGSMGGGGIGMQGGMGMGLGMGMGMQSLGMQGMGMPQQGMGYYGMPQGMPPPQMQPQHHQPQQPHGYGVPQQQGGYNPFTDPSNTTVFIGGLNPSVTDDDLKQNFSQFGDILHTKIPPGRGCGFVTYAHRTSAETAIQQMNNAIIGMSQSSYHFAAISMIILLNLSYYFSGGARVRLSWGKAQPAIMKAAPYGGNPNGSAYSGPSGLLGNTDPIHADPVDRLNETYITQKEESLDRIDVEGTGWRNAQKQVYAQ
ncbi:hypothetical protein HK101_008232 [Irineochytrium annulatum]|nr:hypothetical protein HK101_008232 [Irineochytrium annulatum]